MGERKNDRQALKVKLDTLTDSEIAEVSDYISIMESLREQSCKPDLFDDELVSVLADSVENRRARVVTEWDRVRRQAEHRVAMYAASGKPS